MKSGISTYMLLVGAQAWKPVTYSDGGAVEYFGANGKDYGIGQKKNSVTYGPGSVSSSSFVSYSSSTSDSSPHGKKDLGGPSILADIVSHGGYDSLDKIEHAGGLHGGLLRGYGDYAGHGFGGYGRSGYGRSYGGYGGYGGYGSRSGYGAKSNYGGQQSYGKS